MTKHEFDVEVQKDPQYDVTAIMLPFSVEKIFGKKGLVKVKGTINGYPFRNAISPQGDGTHYMVVNKELRKASGVKGGDVVRIVMEIDTDERLVEVPEDFQAILDTNPDAKTFFDGLTASYRGKYVTWITSAKKAETRTARLEKVIEKLLNKVKDPQSG